MRIVIWSLMQSYKGPCIKASLKPSLILKLVSNVPYYNISILSLTVTFSSRICSQGCKYISSSPSLWFVLSWTFKLFPRSWFLLPLLSRYCDALKWGKILKWHSAKYTHGQLSTRPHFYVGISPRCIIEDLGINCTNQMPCFGCTFVRPYFLIIFQILTEKCSLFQMCVFICCPECLENLKIFCWILKYLQVVKTYRVLCLH